MQSRLVRHKQTSAEKIGFRFNSAIMGALAIFVQWRDMLVPEKEVSQLVADVTALPQRMVGVVMHNGGPNSAWHRHS